MIVRAISISASLCLSRAQALAVKGGCEEDLTCAELELAPAVEGPGRAGSSSVGSRGLLRVGASVERVSVEEGVGCGERRVISVAVELTSAKSRGCSEMTISRTSRGTDGQPTMPLPPTPLRWRMSLVAVLTNL